MCVKCGRHHEFDDWMAARNLPFLFQTEKGVKVGCFPSGLTVAQTYKKYFEPTAENSSLPIIEGRLSEDDTAPWALKSKALAKEFFSHFGCECGAKNWELSTGHAIAAMASFLAPIVLVYYRQMRKGLAMVSAGAVSFFSLLLGEWKTQKPQQEDNSKQKPADQDGGRQRGNKKRGGN